MTYESAKPITPSLEEAIKTVANKNNSLKVRAGVDYEFAKRHNQDPYFSVTHNSKHTAGIAGNEHISEVAHNDPEKLHHLMAIKRMHLRSATDGAPMHAKDNAYFHAGIGKYSVRNIDHLAHHLDVPYEHASIIQNQVDGVSTPEAKKKIIDAHIENLKPRWKQQATDAHIALEHLKN